MTLAVTEVMRCRSNRSCIRQESWGGAWICVLSWQIYDMPAQIH